MRPRKSTDRKRWRRRSARVQRQREWLSVFRDAYVCGWSETDDKLRRGCELLRSVKSVLTSGSLETKRQFLNDVLKEVREP